MIILHGGVSEGRFLLWGEKSLETTITAVKRRGRKPKRPRAAPLPFGAGLGDLEAAMREAGLDREAGERVEVGAWLPTAGGLPLPSSGLIGEAAPVEGAEVILAPWLVEAIALGNREMLGFLGACLDRQVLAPGLVVGRDLAFWGAAARFAATLVARQLFLPAVAGEGGVYYARWQPVLRGEAAGAFSRLARAMPDVGRALGSPEGAEPVREPAAGVLAVFVGRVVDWLVRSSTSGQASAVTTPRRGRPRQVAAFDSLHDQWLHALGAADGRLHGETGELAAFAAQVVEWQRRVSVTAGAPFRLCLRLEEPEEEDGRWRVHYLLQSSADPSLLVPAKSIWRACKEASLLARGSSVHPREYLLAALGQAAGLCPGVEQSLREPAPDGYDLDTAGAHAFLTEEAPALENAGFGVLLPAWWTGRGSKLRLAARVRAQSGPFQAGGGVSLADVVEFDWEVALGGETISRRELEALARLKTPLVKLRGQWVEVSAAELQAALDLWKKGSGGRAPAREVVAMALGARPAAGGLALEGVTATGWLGELLSQLAEGGQYEETEPPDGLAATLRPYQRRGYSWLAFLSRWGLGACLADDMGLGKTVQTLALLQRHWAGGNRRPSLLVCPTSLLGNWEKESARFTPGLPVLVHHGPDRLAGAEFTEQAGGQALVITSYGLLHRDLETLRGVAWAGVILDEAQNIKNAQTMQARAARALRADYRVALTGTPVENHVGDLWSIMEFLNPGLLGTQAEFQRRFFLPIQVQRDAEAARQLQGLTRPFILRRLKTDRSIIADLPEKLEMKVYCTLTREQASLYAAVVAEVTERLETAAGMERRGLVLSALSRLKQVCNHPAQFLGDNSALAGRSGKLARLTEMLEEVLEGGERALVFTQFAEMGELIKRHLQETFGREVFFLHGGVSKGRREEMVERFQAAGGPPVFILSLKAGGTGLNLTGANHVFHFDRWWNPAVEDQATDRAFRIGQRRNVQVHKFVCAGTVEERIDQMLERKQELAGQIVGSGEGWLTELSTDELRELFALGKEAVRE